MQREFIISIDQGTTGTRVFLFDRAGRPVASRYEELPQYFPRPGWVEHDAEEIWQAAVRLIQEVLTAERVQPSEIAGIGITNQRETIVVWDRKTGEPLHKAIVWQCRRSADICRRLADEGLDETVADKTGLRLDPYFSGTKITWLMENVPEVRAALLAGRAVVGTIDSWLIYKLSGGASHVTDMSNASRTLLFNIRDLKWDDDLLNMLGVPAAALPEPVASSGIIARTVQHGALPSGVPIAGVAGDQQAALFGQACFEPGMAKNTYGTGCFLLMQTGRMPVRSSTGLLTTVAWNFGSRTYYALEGSIFIAGAAIQWLRDGLKIIESAPESEELARSVDDTGGLYFVPAFVGLGAPYWDMEARGLITGITRGTSRAHLARAALEAIAYQTKDVLDAMSRDSGINLRALRVDGGATANAFLMQFQADILNIPVERPIVMETTALGAALLAGLGVGWWASVDDLAGRWEIGARFEPVMGAEQRDALYRGWVDAVQRSRRDMGKREGA